MVSTDEYLPSNALRTADDVNTTSTTTVSPGSLDNALNNASNGDRIELEAGTYTLSSTHSPPSNFALVGATDSNGVPTTTLTSSDTGGRFLISGTPSGDVAICNLIIDYGFNWDNSLGIRLLVGGHGLVRNVEFRGSNPQEPIAVDNLVPVTTSSSGTFVVRNVARTGPTDITSHGSQGDGANEGCIWLGSNAGHTGRLYICDSEFANTGTNAIYASRIQGSIHIHRSLFRNNNQASVRMGGGSRPLTINESVFFIDTNNAHSDNRGDYINPSGPIFETDNDRAGVESQPITVTNTDFWLKSSPDRGQLIFIDGNAGPVTFEGSRIRSEQSSAPAVYAITDPRWSDPAPDQTISFESSEISGSGPITVKGGRTATATGCVSAPTSSVTINTQERSNCELPGNTISGVGTGVEGSAPGGGGTVGSGSGGGGIQLNNVDYPTGNCEFVNGLALGSGSSGVSAASASSSSGYSYLNNQTTADVEEITVAAGNTESITLSGGEEYRNKLIDVSAAGASFEITAQGDDWTISNIGIKGQNSTSGVVAELQGNGVMDTVYLGDGSDGATAVTVPPSHAGSVKLSNLNISGYQHGIWAGDPGNPANTTLTPGSGGSVQIKNCYASSCDGVAYQVGTDGSLVESSVATMVDQGVWGRWQSTSAEDCDIQASACYVAGALSPPERPATLSVSNCRAQGAQKTAGSGTVNGNIASSPTLDLPEGVPEDADAALVASGTTTL